MAVLPKPKSQRKLEGIEEVFDLFQSKEQDTFLETNSKGTEIYKLPDEEFKITM